MKFAAAICQIGLALLLLHGGPANAQDVRRPLVADAKPGDVRVLVTAAIREPLDAVLAQARQVVGRPLWVEYGSARGNLKDKILAGQDFEVAILLPDVDEELLKQGKNPPAGELRDCARVNVAIPGCAATRLISMSARPRP